MEDIELLDKMEQKLKLVEDTVRNRGELSTPDFFEFRAATRFVRSGIIILKHNIKGE